MYERHHERLIPRRHFYRRVGRSVLVAAAIIACSLTIGLLGYRFIVGFSWTDAFLNAAMILSGMGPVDEVAGDGAKVFAGFYALFSGIIFLSTAAVLFAPLVHRMLHRFHAVSSDHDEGGGSGSPRKKKSAS